MLEITNSAQRTLGTYSHVPALNVSNNYQNQVISQLPVFYPWEKAFCSTCTFRLSRCSNYSIFLSTSVLPPIKWSNRKNI